MSGRGFIDNVVRYCLWLVDATPVQLRRMPQVRRRLEAVTAFRDDSKAASTRAYANRPALSGKSHNPKRPILAFRRSLQKEGRTFQWRWSILRSSAATQHNL